MTTNRKSRNTTAAARREAYAKIREDLDAMQIDYSGLSKRDFVKLADSHGLLDKHGLGDSAPAEPAQPAAEPAQPAAEPAQAAPAPAAPAPTGDTQAALAALIATLQPAPAEPAVSEERIVELIHEHSAAPVLHSVEYVTPKQVEPAKEDLCHKCMAEVMDWLVLGENVYIYGPPASGKTHMGKQIADLMGLNFYSTSAIMQKYELTGFKDAQGVFQTTEFIEWMRKGGLYLWDEVDGSQPSAMVAFNGVLENGYLATPDGNIDLHPDCIAIASANTIGTGATQEFVGRFAMDKATRDRFAPVHMPYDDDLNKTLALREYAKYNGEDTAFATRVIDWLVKVREALLAERIHTALVTPRLTRRAVKMLAHKGNTRNVVQRIKDMTFTGLTEDQINNCIRKCGEFPA